MKTQTKKITRNAASRNGHVGQPAWEIAQFFPMQGEWSEEDYLDLDTNRLVELSDHRLEVLPMATTFHQWVALCLYELLKAFAWPKIGLVLAAPLPIRLWPGKMREPDVLFMFNENRQRVHEEYWDGADLVMEVVSAGSEAQRRDRIKKKAEYARARIPEYWLVEPKKKQITVYYLKGTKYAVHGVFKNGKATSRLLPKFGVDVETLFTGP